MLIDIEKVKVSDRIRKDFGNIEELAKDIKENGLINPPVVTPEYELIAGERRLRALKHLGKTDIEVRIMTVNDALHQLKLEISENENRKDFSFNEKMAWAKMLEKEYGKIALERKKGGQGGVLLSPKSDKANIRTDKKVAQEVGFGGKEKYRQAKYISENATEEMIAELDEGKLSINKAYVTLKEKKKKLEQENNQLKQLYYEAKNKSSDVIDNTDHDSISILQNSLEKKEEQIKILNREKNVLKAEAELNKIEADEYQELKNNIKMLKSQKDDIYRQIEAATSISGLVVEIEDLLQTKLAPIKYSRAIEEQREDEIVIGNVKEILHRVENWCVEMRTLLPQNENIIEMEVE
jgi:ParB family chromosome partitioning protein